MPVDTLEMPGIDSVAPVSDSDLPCLAEVRSVLEKHGALERFGVTLLHGHFPVGPSEVMVESCDHENRTLTIQPKKSSELEGKPMVGTTWRLGKGETIETMLYCQQVCIPGRDGHQQHHHYTR